MDNHSYTAAVNTTQIAAGLLLNVDLAGMLAAMGRAEALGPILDPTLYQQASGRMEAQRRLIEAALPLQAEIRRQFATAQIKRAG